MLYSFLLSLGLLSSGLSFDSIPFATDSLDAVTVTADKGVVISRKDTLSTFNSFTITDVLLRSPGVYVGDNGGQAGLKTVSLRGFGSAHTSIYIDGVRVGNVQSGQSDLGMLGLENFNSLVVDYAQNSISFNTRKPLFTTLPVAGVFKLGAGSFGTYLPYARLDFKLSDNVSLSANAAGTFSRGDFTYGEGMSRTNNDISQIRAGIDLFGLISGGEYHLKAYYNDAERGTPGSISWPSDDRQADRNVFLQGRFLKTFSPVYAMQISAKGSYDDISYSSSFGDSRYAQTEVQLNSAHYFRVNEWWKVSLAADVQWDGLYSTNYEASRLSVFSAFASSFSFKNLKADIALEYSGAFDTGYMSRNAFSPSVDVRLTIFDGLDIVAFCRRAYRVPTFNELYYVGYGNPDLKPEDTWVYDLGLDFNRKAGDSWRLKAKVNGFYNSLTDKIVSAPSEIDQNVWMPYNIGKVEAMGVDTMAGAYFSDGVWSCGIDARYTFMSAFDRTSGSVTEGKQIPYISRHTLSIDCSVAWRGWTLSPVVQYRAGRTDGYGEMPDWNTFGLILSKSFSIRDICILNFNVSSSNMTDCRYEVVSGYPMPGRSITGGVEIRF